jgi:hypothetical protein
MPGDFDFIFMDGDHSWEGISRDWTEWSPRVSHQGWMVVRDTCRTDPVESAHLDSYRFYEEIICKDPGFELVEQVDSLTVLRRR